MSGLISRDIPGYLGKDIEIWVWTTGPLTFPETAVKKQIKSATGFNPSEESAEVKTSYLGFDVEQTIYGTISHTLSIPMTVRDLVDIARAVGIDPATSKKISVADFKRVNLVAWHKDIETGNVNYSECIGGFRARSFSSTKATGALDTVTIEGTPDLIIRGDGKVEIIEFIGDGSKKEFDLPAGIVEDDVICVENPKTVQKDTGWTYTATGGSTPTTPCITFDDAPADNSIVRIYFKVA